MTFTPQERAAVTAMQKLAREYTNASPDYSFDEWLSMYKLPEQKENAKRIEALPKDWADEYGPKPVGSKKQWVPKMGETYYMPDVGQTGLVSFPVWQNRPFEHLRLERDLVRQTEDEARKMAHRMLAAIKK